MENPVIDEQILYLVCKYLDVKSLLVLSTVNKCMCQIANSLIKQRFLALIEPSVDKVEDKPVLFFESSSPADPAKLLQHPLLFQEFFSPGTDGDKDAVTPSRIIAHFKFREFEVDDFDDILGEATPAHASRSFRFTMDESQSFQTFLLSVRLRSMDNRWRRGIYRHEVELAEGLERVWKTWFEAEPTNDRGRTIYRHQPLDRNASMRSLSIEQTIAKANLLVYPQPSSERSASRSGIFPPIKTNTYEMAWQSCDLSIARVVVGIEEAERKREGAMVLYLGSGSTGRMPSFNPRYAWRAM